MRLRGWILALLLTTTLGAAFAAPVNHRKSGVNRPPDRRPTVEPPPLSTRLVQESKTEDGVLMEFVLLSNAPDFAEGTCEERGNTRVVGIKVNAPYHSVKRDTETLIADLKAAGALKGARVNKVSRGFIRADLRGEDYNGIGPETACLELDEDQGKDVCEAFRRSALKFGWGFKYSGCLSSAGLYDQSLDQLQQRHQQVRPHNASSDYAQAILQIAPRRHDDARSRIEAKGYSVLPRGPGNDFLLVPTGTDDRAQFARFCRALTGPDSPIIGCEANAVMKTF